MNIVDVSLCLSQLDFVFPSQTSSVKKKEQIIDAWYNIIFNGEGFDSDKPGVLKDPLKAYLKNKTECGGNIVKFCDQFWEEILNPQLEKLGQRKLEYKKIEDIFAMFKILSQGYIEADTSFVRKFPYFITTSWSGCSDCFLNLLKEWLIPGYLYSVPIALSRYRTARQCSVSMSHLANKLKTFTSDQGATVTSVFNKFKEETQAKAARSIKEEGVVSRDDSMKITEIKKIQMLRYTSTVLKVILAVGSAFWYISSVVCFSAATPLFIPLIAPFAVVGYFVLTAILAAVNGHETTLGGCFAFLTFLNMKAGSLASFALAGVLLKVVSRDILMSVLSPGPVFFVCGLYATVFIVFGIGLILFEITEGITVENRFYAYNLLNDPLAPLLEFLANRSSEIMDGVLFLVDGSDQAV